MIVILQGVLAGMDYLSNREISYDGIGMRFSIATVHWLLFIASGLFYTG